jgi:hypothetical protein
VTLYNESWLETRCRLIAPTVEVGKNGGWGSFYVDGGSLQSKNFSVCASAAVPEGGLLLTLGKQKVSGKLYLYNLFNYATAGVRINFKGGLVRANYGGAAKLFNPVSGDIFLSSVNGEDIKIANENLYPELMLMNASSEYAGKLKTEGDGDFVVDGDFMIDGKGGSADAMFLMMGKNVKNTAVWGHKGDFVLKNHSVLFSADDTAPANENTGMIRLSVKDPEHPSLFKMDKYSQKVNGIVVADGEYGRVIAEAGAVLTVGLYKDGALANVDLGTDVKIVQAGNTVSFACDSVSAYQVNAGTLKIMRSTVIDTLELAAGVTVDIAEGAFMQVGTLKDDGAIFTGKGRFGIAEGCAYLHNTPGVKTVKLGMGTFVYNQKAQMGDVDVLEGTLKLAGVGSTNEWWRVTVKESGWRLNIAAIGLFTGATLDSVLDGYTYSQANDLSSIAKGQIYYDTTKYGPEVMTGSAESENPAVTFTDDASVLLNSDPTTGMIFRSITSEQFQSPKDIAFTFRRAEEDTVPVTCFSLRYPINAYSKSHDYAARGAAKYVFETSVDGVDWIEVGSVDSRGEGTWGSWTDNRAFPMTLPPGVPVCGGLGVAEDAAVRVASGATLDLTDATGNNLVSKLVVDASGDNGIILGSQLAAEGVVIIRNFATKEALKGVKLLSFPGMTADLSGWQVRDESGNSLRVAFAVRDGDMIVVDRGLVISVR